MSIKNTILDGTGSGLEAKVKTTRISNEQALCVNIAGISAGVELPATTAVGGNQYSAFLTLNNDGTTSNAGVNGSVTPQVFSIKAIEDYDIIITELVITGADGGIKINNFLGLSTALTNGCNLVIKTDNTYLTTRNFKTTTDFAVYASLGGFDLFSEAAGDLAKTIRQYNNPSIVLRAIGTFGIGDSLQDIITFTVNDNLTAVTQLTIQARGFYSPAGVL